MTSSPNPIRIACVVTACLETLEIPYVVGGSVASALYGEPRFTKDVDISAALEPKHVDPLVDQLEAEFFVDREALREAIARNRMEQLIHRASYVKVDLFVPLRGGLDDEKWTRRQRVSLGDGDAWVTDPECIVLQKLRWFRDGGEVSDQQWRDVLGVLKVQRGNLDSSFLHEWAARVDVLDLLNRAVEESRG